MIKLLLLQQLYNLSDDALEYQVLDRASFLRFAGLEHSRRVPDAKTLWVWRERLKTQDLIGDISAAVSGQLQRTGFIARGGQIIDASVVSAPTTQGPGRQAAEPTQHRRNHRIATDRAVGEHVFARLAQQGGKHLRTIGLARAQVVIGPKVAMHNLMRLARLQHRGIVPV